MPKREGRKEGRVWKGARRHAGSTGWKDRREWDVARVEKVLESEGVRGGWGHRGRKEGRERRRGREVEAVGRKEGETGLD